ncbi:MAG: methyltransferase domain-containing protein, partial [bacterium]|nr:methyltransferase domain-containing protein [bacterium]
MKGNDRLKINLGSSGFNEPGYINVDIRPSVKPEVLHDLNVFPYPFKDNSADIIKMSHILEHLEKPFKVMEELHRVLKPSGQLHIQVPHFSRGFTHAEHEHGFDVSFPYYFMKEKFPEQFYGSEYELVRLRLNWLSHITIRYLPHLGFNTVTIFFLKGFHKVFTALANVSP